METPANAAIVKLAEKLTGHATQAAAFATEAPYLRQLGMDTVVLGPGDIAQAHQPDEYLALDRLTPTIDILKQVINTVCVRADPLI
jgi:acetylornithine deacetylase